MTGQKWPTLSVLPFRYIYSDKTCIADPSIVTFCRWTYLLIRQLHCRFTMSLFCFLDQVHATSFQRALEWEIGAALRQKLPNFAKMLRVWSWPSVSVKTTFTGTVRVADKIVFSLFISWWNKFKKNNCSYSYMPYEKFWMFRINIVENISWHKQPVGSDAQLASWELSGSLIFHREISRECPVGIFWWRNV